MHYDTDLNCSMANCNFPRTSPTFTAQNIFSLNEQTVNILFSSLCFLRGFIAHLLCTVQTPLTAELCFDSEKESSRVPCICLFHKHYFISVTFSRKKGTLSAIESLVSATFNRPNHKLFLSVPAVLCIVIYVPTSDNESCTDSTESKGITPAKSTLA